MFRTVISRKFVIAAGHRLLGHAGPCRHPHGHNYEITVTLAPRDAELNADGFVIDFADVKRLIGMWLDENWDHKFLINSNDATLMKALAMVHAPLFVFPNMNPTAENMAAVLLSVINHNLLMGAPVVAVEIIVQETPNCAAVVHA